MKKFFREHKALRLLLPGLLVLLMVIAVLPVFAAAPDYLTVTGVYDVRSNLSTKYLDGTRHPTMPKASLTLTITTQTSSVISAATLATASGPVTMTGVLGGGLRRPYIALFGTTVDNQTSINLYGRFTVKDGVPTKLTGRIDGFCISEGYHWEDSADGTTAASIVQANSGSYSTLLTAGTLDNPETILFHCPRTNIKLKHLDTLAAGKNGISFYYYASGTTNGPQIMLRFALKGSTEMTYYHPSATAGHVDVTVMPLQSGATATAWTKYTVTSASGPCVYYGGDSTDYTGFGGTPIATLGEVEAAINAEAAMTAGTDTCGTWVLTMVGIELWEGGARTAYIDDVQIGRYTYRLEPIKFDSRFRATKQ